LRNECEQQIASLGKKQLLAKQFLNYLFSQPFTDAASVSKDLHINISTTLRLINDFIKLGILNEVTGNKRNRVFVFENYIKLFR